MSSYKNVFGVHKYIRVENTKFNHDTKLLY